MMLPSPLKVIVMLGTRFAPLDNAERLDCITAKRLRTLLWTKKAAALGSSLPSPSGQWSVASKQPWGEGGTSRTAGTESVGSVGGLSELCATTAWAVTPLPWEPHPPTVPLFSLPGWWQSGPEHLLPPWPLSHNNGGRRLCQQRTVSTLVTFSSQHFRTFSSLCDAVWLHYPGLGTRPCPGV